MSRKYRGLKDIKKWRTLNAGKQNIKKGKRWKIKMYHKNE